VHRQRGKVLAIEKYAAMIRGNQPDDHVKRGGLAGTVRSEQADDFAARNFE